MKPLLLSLLLVLLAVPAFAQDKAAPAAAVVEEPVSKEKIALAEKMHEIWPIRTRIESALDAVAEGYPEDKQAELKAAMRRSIKFDEVEEESIKAMASIFTEKELQAMIDFYGSDAGRSVSEKTGDYEDAMRPVITKMMDKAMLDLRTGNVKP